MLYYLFLRRQFFIFFNFLIFLFVCVSRAYAATTSLHTKTNIPMTTSTKDNERIFWESIKTAGFSKAMKPFFYCIAKWESKFDPSAINYNKNKTMDIGLFQINSSWLSKCHTNKEDLLSPKNNAACAMIIFQRQGLTAWKSYKERLQSGQTQCITAMLGFVPPDPGVP